MSEQAVDRLRIHLATCQSELDTIGREVDALSDHLNPATVRWDLVGSVAHLAELLTQARVFIRDEED